jgi:hypothetical protein
MTCALSTLPSSTVSPILTLLFFLIRGFTGGGQQGFQNAPRLDSFIVDGIGAFGTVQSERGLTFYEAMITGHMYVAPVSRCLRSRSETKPCRSRACVGTGYRNLTRQQHSSRCSICLVLGTRLSILSSRSFSLSPVCGLEFSEPHFML